MRIGFIGAGKVGTAMGIYLINSKVNIVGYYSKSFSSAKNASLMTDSKAYDSLYDLISDANIIAITTPDDTISTIVSDMNKSNINFNNKIIFHMSGVHSSEILLPLYENKKDKITILSLHPLLTFSDPIKSAEELKTAIFTLEGKGEKLTLIKKLFERSGNKFMEITTESKGKYHAACTVLSNYVVSIIDIGLNMLTEAGFSKEEAIQLASPLITKTLENVSRFGTEKALTGPVSRGDIGTIRKHLDFLAEYNNWENVYKAIGVHTVTLAKRAGTINQDQELKMMEVFKNYE